MRKLTGVLAVVVSGLLAATAVSAPAQAATPALRFHGAQYDSPGKDTRSKASLNAEWISLINSGTKAVNLNGYTIRDKAGHNYRFGSFVIPARGGRVWLHTGSGKNDSNERFWGSGNYIWNNTGDTAYLRNASGKTLDTCSWGQKSGRNWVAC
jgi:Lamin Tail Domain